MHMFTIVDELRGEMACTSSTSGIVLVVALLSSRHQGNPLQGDHRHAPWSPVVCDNIHTHITYASGSNFSNNFSNLQNFFCGKVITFSMRSPVEALFRDRTCFIPQ